MEEIDYQLLIKTKINKMDNNLLKMYFFYFTQLAKKSMNFKLRDTIEKTYYTNIRIIIIFTLENLNYIFKKYNSKCENILKNEKNYKEKYPTYKNELERKINKQKILVIYFKH